MHIYINQNTIGKKQYEALVKLFPNVSFVNEMTDKVEACIAMPNLLVKEHLRKMPNLKWAQILTVGYNQVDFDYLKKHDITLTNAKDVYAITIAEDIITKILVLNRNVKKYIKQMETGSWIRHNFEPEIYGSTIGFLGSGSLASHAAERLKAFGATVICYRKTPIHNPVFKDTYHDEQGLDNLMRQSDVVVVTLPLSNETKGLVDKRRLSLMKRDAILINVGRGEVIDQNALIEALRNHQIRGAALDVTVPEPLDEDNPLWKMDNVFITPHNAPSSPYMLERLNDLIAFNINQYLNKKHLKNIV